MSAGEDYERFFLDCRDAAGREIEGRGKGEGVVCGCVDMIRRERDETSKLFSRSSTRLSSQLPDWEW
jgi:hypothetical protein